MIDESSLVLFCDIATVVIAFDKFLPSIATEVHLINTHQILLFNMPASNKLQRKRIAEPMVSSRHHLFLLHLAIITLR